MGIALHFGRLAQQHIHGHIDRLVDGIGHHQLALFGGHTDDGKGATLALAQGFKFRQRLGCNRHDIALLRFIAPNLFGRHARFFQRHFRQIKARATASVVHQFRKGVRNTARADIVYRQNRVGHAAQIALGDDFLRTALNLRVAALYRIKIQRRVVRARRHRAGRAATHADAHAWPAQLNQQAARRKCDFLRQLVVYRADATRNHDGLVIAALHACDFLLKAAEIARQHRAAKFIAKGCATQWAFGHDLQRRGHMRRKIARCAV